MNEMRLLLLSHWTRCPTGKKWNSLPVSGQGKPVLVRQGNVLASTFHPEIEGENRVHQWFAGLVK